MGYTTTKNTDRQTDRQTNKHRQTDQVPQPSPGTRAAHYIVYFNHLNEKH